MSEDPKTAWKKVTPVGDAWIVCKSKSHRGYNYYFNTATGETTWNLSDAEVEKARKFTKKLETQPGATPTKCPEPKDHPPPPSMSSSPNKPLLKKLTQSPRKHLINPFINDQINSTSFSSIYQNSQFCNVLNQMHNFAGETLNNMNSLNLNPMACAPNLSLYNPNVWAVPRTQQIFITPTIAPGPVNQAHASIHVSYDHIPMNMSQAGPSPSDSIQNSDCFEDGNQLVIQGSPKRTRNFYPKYDKFYKEKQNKLHTFHNTQKTDLRQRLGDSKRHNSISNIKSLVSFNIKEPELSNQLQSTDSAAESTSYDYNTDVIMNHRYAQTHEESSKLDLTTLKSLALPDVNPDKWFIAVDLNVLLKEFKFLNNLIDSDKKCHLMVPSVVMTELKEHVSSYQDVPARRILRFLSQQIEFDYACMADAPSNLETDNKAEVIVKTCIEKSNHNYFLVLLSNDEEILGYKDSSNIIIFSVTDIQNLLNCPLSNPTPCKTNPAFSLERIQIVVPNNKEDKAPLGECFNANEANPENMVLDDFVAPEYNNEGVDEREKACSVDLPNCRETNTEIQLDEYIVPEFQKLKEKVAQRNDKSLSKRTVDAGIQTDFQCIIVTDNNDKETDSTNKQRYEEFSTNSVNVSEPSINFPVHESVNKREIRLKRSISNEQPVKESCEKKHFKWRRRRNIISAANTKFSEADNASLGTNRSPIGVISGTEEKDRLGICRKSLWTHIAAPNNVTNIRVDGMNAEKITFDVAENNGGKCGLTLRRKNIENTPHNVTVTKKSENNETSKLRCDESKEKTDQLSLIRNEQIIKGNNKDKIRKPIVNTQEMDEIKSPLKAGRCKDKYDRSYQQSKTISTDITSDVPRFFNDVEFDKNETTKMHSPNVKGKPKVIRNIKLIPDDTSNKTSNESVVSSESSVVFLSRDAHGSNNNITIDETSTSGIISNSESNIDERDISICPQEESDFEQSMYHIDNESMGEYLAMKCDEWVSRYIQIMEEVLTIVLNQDPPFSHDTLSPPWTLHEAAQCIKFKFKNYPNICDGANKLSIILFNVSDARGKISMDMSPYQYMKMYSAGMYLLAALKGVMTNLEDIQIAIETLKLLLDDIRNPNKDICAPEVFNDSAENQILKTIQSTPEKQFKHGKIHNKENETQELVENEPMETEVTQRPSVKFIRKVDITPPVFKKTFLKKTDPGMDNNAINKKDQQNVEECANNVKLKCKADSVPPVNQPKIVRNFTFCADIEKKLKSKLQRQNYEEHDFDLDYEEDYDECIDEEFEEGECHEAEEEEEYDMYDEEQNYESGSQKTVDPILNDSANEKFRVMMHVLLQEISTVLCEVIGLSDKCYAEMRRPHQSEAYKCELKQMAEKAKLHLSSICETLASMLDQERDSPENRLRQLLKNADITMGYVDDRLLSEFRSTLGECKDYAAIFLDRVQDIIAVFNS